MASPMYRKRTTIKLRDDKPRRNPYSSDPPTAKESIAKQNKEPELYSLGRETSLARIPSLTSANSALQDRKKQRWKMVSKKAKGQQMVKHCVESVFNPMLERGRSFVHIIVAGDRFKTTKATIDTYPESLLASKDAEEYWDELRKAYVFPEQCRQSFDNILFFYQSKGMLRCPPNISMENFKEECTFFRLDQESIDRCEHGAVLDMVLEREEEDKVKPSGFLTNCGRRLTPGGWAKKLLGGIDMVATVLYILILMLMTKGDDQVKSGEDTPTNTTVVEEDEGKPTKRGDILGYLSATCVLWFIIHYIINFLTSSNKRRYCLGLLSLIDFLVVSSFVIDFFSHHIIRIEDKKKEKNIKNTITNMRILIGVARQLCIARYSTLLYCLGVALKKSGKDLLHILYILVIVILVFSSAAFFFECDSGLHILKEEVLWVKVHKSFQKGSNLTEFRNLEKIAVGDIYSNDSRYFTKFKDEETKKQFYNISTVIKYSKGKGVNSTAQINVTKLEQVITAEVPDKQFAKILPDTYSLDPKVYKQYIGFDKTSEKAEQYAFQPVIQDSTLKMLIVEDYVALDMSDWNLSVERQSRFESIPASLWWGFITITTVGYGDLAPRTTWGKVISAVLALTGIPLIAIPLPLIMNKFTQLYRAKKREDSLERHAAKLLQERAAERARKKKESRDMRESSCLLRSSGSNRFELQSFVMECDEKNGTTLKTCFDDVLNKPAVPELEPMEKKKNSAKPRPRIFIEESEVCDVSGENNTGDMPKSPV